MATQVQLRRGTTAENNAFTGAQGELSVDTDLTKLILHDGATAGGHKIATEAFVISNPIVGPVGPQGPAGADGYVGADGPVGPQGPAGADGPVGPQGPQGIQGVAGATGIQGPAGQGFEIFKSYNSVAALLADTAPTGIQSGQFAIINTGNINDSDDSKLYLWTGVSYQYITDLSGATGIKGETGDQGVQGIQGIQGVQGVQGIQGNEGAQGPQGVQGPKGDTGDVGPQGVKGLDAYEEALQLGFSGTLQQWLDTLKGDKGDKGDPGIVGTANVSITGSTLSTVNTDESITIAPNGTGEVHIQTQLGVRNNNPGFTIEVGNVSESEASGEIGYSFNDGASYSGTASVGWAWDNGAGHGNNLTGSQHAKFGLFRNGSPSSPWITFDKATPAHAMEFDDIGNVVINGLVAPTLGIRFDDGSTQTTASLWVTAPTSSIGKVGDDVGMTAIDLNYLYYCIAAYDGATQIWKRQPLTGSTW